MHQGRIVRESLDLGEIRDNLKRAWFPITHEPLTVADVEKLDRLLNQCEGHRRKLYGHLRPPAAPAVTCGVAPEPPPAEPPMSRQECEAEARRMLADIERRLREAAP